MVAKESVIEALKKVVDPEIRLDVWTLGLIYDIKILDSDKVYIKMTFTTPFCPYGEVLLDMVREEVSKLGVKDVDIEVTFEPMWSPSEEVKMMLGIA